jgi:hypothetical protein
MKTLRLKITTFFLIGVVFLSSSGFGLIQRTSLMSGKKRTALRETKGCCPTKAAPNHCSPETLGDTILKADQCCKSGTEFFAIDLAPVVGKVGQFMSNLFYVVVDRFLALIKLNLLRNTAVHEATDSSPPLAGKQILLQKQTLQL